MVQPKRRTGPKPRPEPRPKADAATLSDRELAVLRGIARAQTYPQIAHELGVAYDTVKMYASRLRSKLGVNTKLGLALYAVRCGLVKE